MENYINLSVILPIKSAAVKDFDELFEKAINSLKNQKLLFNELIIVHTDETKLVDVINGFDFGDLNVKKLLWTKEPSYSNQINFGVENSSAEWVSFFEFDDEYSSIWFKNVNRFIKAYPEVDAFLPLVVDTDEKGMFVGFTNEATFAASLNSEIGYLTNDVLMAYQNFQSSGMVIKKDTYLENGGFKSSMKLTFVYEFLLRLTYNSVNIMTIPRIGYKHMNLREGSIFWNYKNGNEKISDKEVSFWIESAKKEHFFTSDRNIKFEPEQA